MPGVSSDLCANQGCSVWGSFNDQASSSFLVQDQAPPFHIAYGDNSEYLGVYAYDSISVGGPTMENVTFAVVTQAQNIVGGGTAAANNGLMGIGFDIGEAGAERGTLSKPYAGIITQLKRNNLINTRAYSLWLDDLNAPSGSILFGGVDTSKYTAPLLGLPMVGTNSSNYAKIDRLAVEFTGLSLSDDKGTTPLGSSFVLPALLDSGTTDSLLPTDLVHALWSSAGVITDPAVQVPIIACNLAKASASYVFAFGGDSGPKINVSLSQLVTPLEGLTFKDGSPACQFGIIESPDGRVVLGDTFLRSAYVVYDLDNKIIAMAQTNTNGGAPNIQEISGSALPGVSTVLPSMALPATLAVATAAATTQVGGPTATPTLANNGQLTEVPGKASFTPSPSAAGQKGAAGAVVANTDAAFVVCGVVSLLTVLGGSTFWMLA